MIETLMFHNPNSEEKNKIIWDHLFEIYIKPIEKRLKIGLFIILSIIPFIILSFFENEISIGIFLILIFIGLSISYIQRILKFRQYKKDYFQKAKEDNEKLRNASIEVIWELNPEYFSISNYKSKHQIIWSEITYNMFNNRFLHVVYSNLHFILDRENIDDETFQKAIKYISNKAKVRDLKPKFL